MRFLAILSAALTLSGLGIVGVGVCLPPPWPPIGAGAGVVVSLVGFMLNLVATAPGNLPPSS